MEKIIRISKANKGSKANSNLIINEVTEASALTSVMEDVDNQKKSVADLMAETEVQFAKGNGSTIKSVTESMQEYLLTNKDDLMGRAKELGKGNGGRILDEILVKYYIASSGLGVSKADMQAILLTAQCGRDDVNGYSATFASNIDAPSKDGCPKRVKRFKSDSKYCVVIA